MGNIFVPVDDRLYSTLQIGTEDFPFGLFHDDLDNYRKGFVNWHNQTQLEISCILEGSIKVCLLKEEHILTAGNAFIILPDQLHSVQPVEKEPGKYFTLIFDSCLLTGFSGSFFSKKYYEPVANSSSGYYPIPSTPYLQDIFSNLFWIYDHFSEKNPECFLSVQRRLQDIWISLYRNVFHTDPCEEKSGQNARILQMLNYLRQNYPEKFSLSEMAEHLHLSRGECCRFFKKMMGMTISDYLLEYRLGRATELLERTEKSITEIAHEVGFNSVSNFTALFRTKTGLTPSKYRESARNRMK